MFTYAAPACQARSTAKRYRSPAADALRSSEATRLWTGAKRPKVSGALRPQRSYTQGDIRQARVNVVDRSDCNVCKLGHRVGVPGRTAALCPFMQLWQQLV
jgi:hypothetical protein